MPKLSTVPEKWIFFRETGQLFLGNMYICDAYSGAGEGKDNPTMEGVKNVGPIPAGDYEISIDPPGKHASVLIDPVFRFTPMVGTNEFGRSGFLGHGDNLSHTASEGCIVFDHIHRVLMAESIVRVLEVV